MYVAFLVHSGSKWQDNKCKNITKMIVSFEVFCLRLIWEILATKGLYTFELPGPQDIIFNEQKLKTTPFF
jgi:hypothetical protein